jgi:hypothetical protein
MEASCYKAQSGVDIAKKAGVVMMVMNYVHRS